MSKLRLTLAAILYATGKSFNQPFLCRLCWPVAGMPDLDKLREEREEMIALLRSRIWET